MEIEFLKEEKDDIEVKIPNVTLAEILRVSLNKDSGVVFAAWKRKHPTEMPVLAVKTKGKTAKKAINDAINSLVKELDKAEDEFKKVK